MPHFLASGQPTLGLALPARVSCMPCSWPRRLWPRKQASSRQACSLETDAVLQPPAQGSRASLLALTVLVQDLCYSDPLSSVLTISDPIVVRDDLSLACSSLSLCMPRHASMRLSCNKTDRTSLPSHGAAGLSTSPHIAPTHAHRPVRQPNSLAKDWPCSLDSGLRPRAQTPLLVLSRHTFSAFWL